MYSVVNTYTRVASYHILKGLVQKTYAYYSVAQKDAERVEEMRPSLRCDVVEISKVARIYLENQERLRN